MAQKKKLEKETAARQRKWNEEKLELQRNYETVLKNSKNMQGNIKNEQQKKMKANQTESAVKLKRIVTTDVPNNFNKSR